MKAELFLCGYQDYITSPLIPEEILVRVESQFLIQWDKQNHKNYSGEKLFVENTCLYLLDHLATDASLEKIALLLGTNRNSLSQSFKNVTGLGVFTWLREQRMLKAANLLIFTNMTVINICHEVGYTDSNNFSTAFKRFFGLPPNQYRKKMTQSKKCVTGSKDQDNQV